MRSGARSSPDDVWEIEQFVLDEVLQLVAERALAITGADGVAIALAEGNEIVCRASAGGISPDAGARLDPSSGFSGACLRTGQIVRCDDSENDPRVNVQTCRRLGARSMVAVPLAGQQNVIGLLEAFSSEAYGFNDSDVRSLNLLAELILAAMKPEEEDRLAEISQRVVARATQPVVASEAELASARVQAPEQIPNHRGEIEDLEPSGAPAILSEYSASENSRPGLTVVLVLVLLAMALGGGLWWKIRHKTSTTTTQMQQTTPASAVPGASAPSTANEDIPAPPTPEGHGRLPQVTGIRHWSSEGASTVVIDLQGQVQYEAHRLSDPERIYFDLPETSLAPGLNGKTIEVSDAMLVRVRIAQPTQGVTRVVMETKGGSNFSVSLESNPYRLVVEIRRADTEPQPQAKIELFGPLNAPPAKRLMPPPESGSKENTRIQAHLQQFRIVLDAGHGGWDLGTVGRRGLLEKDLVLDIVERLGNLVENRLGSEVIYTRADDAYVALEKRAEIANQSQADLFVSIHANYSEDASARGVETYYTNTYSSVHARTHDTDSAGKTPQNVAWTNVDIREKVQESHRVAASVQRALYGMLAAKNPGIRDRGVKKASYVVLTGTVMPAILAEVSFVSSPTDESNLRSSGYRQEIAEALYKGIARYALDSHRTKIASTSGNPTGQ
jgi:N-acetylmuramoyl-L-alanine amidase/putative methionine-R-sulfoxide reductase with GAF domain